MVPAQGKSELVNPLAIAQLLKIPVFVIFDADRDVALDAGGNPTAKAPLHKKDNERLLKLLGGNAADPYPSSVVLQPTYAIWPKNLGLQVEGDFAGDDWAKWKNETESELGQPGNLGKNTLFIAGMMEKAWADKKPSKTLRDLCEKLIAFAKS